MGTIECGEAAGCSPGRTSHGPNCLVAHPTCGKCESTANELRYTRLECESLRRLNKELMTGRDAMENELLTLRPQLSLAKGLNRYWRGERDKLKAKLQERDDDDLVGAIDLRGYAKRPKDTGGYLSKSYNAGTLSLCGSLIPKHGPCDRPKGHGGPCWHVVDNG